MIIGIGNDIIEQDRIKKACEKDAFLSRIFTERERQMITEHPGRAAGNWAVKEAVVKVFQTGFHGVEPIEVEVLRGELGEPYVNLYGKAKEKAEELGIERIHVSITNIKELVYAVAVGEGTGR